MGKKKVITKEEGDIQVAEQPADIKVIPQTAETPGGAGKKARRKQVAKGIVFISSSYNNTIVTVSDQKGETVTWSSAGSMGFKGARKSTPYAATIVAQNAAEKARQAGLVEASVVVRGIGPGREAAIRGLISAGLNITEIIDDTPIAHNGVRMPRPRRV